MQACKIQRFSANPELWPRGLVLLAGYGQKPFASPCPQPRGLNILWFSCILTFRRSLLCALSPPKWPTDAFTSHFNNTHAPGRRAVRVSTHTVTGAEGFSEMRGRHIPRRKNSFLFLSPLFSFIILSSGAVRRERERVKFDQNKPRTSFLADRSPTHTRACAHHGDWRAHLHRLFERALHLYLLQ